MAARRARIPRKYVIAGIAVLIVGAFLLFISRAQTANACVGQCNIIFIVVDTLAADHLKSYGYERDTMPKVEKFFSSGIRFDKAYSVSPWTEPSFASFFFSDLPSHVTFKDLDKGNRATFVSALRDSGYNVYGVLIPLTVFIYDAIAKVFEPQEIHFVWNAFHVHDPKTPAAEAEEAKVVLKEAVNKWRATGQPFFLMMHDLGPHAPYNPRTVHANDFSSTGDGQVITATDLNTRNKKQDATNATEFLYTLKYDQKIRDVDDALSGFLDSIPPDVLVHTVVVLIADHGEAFDQHGKFGHHQSLHREELRVPFFIRAPGVKSTVVRDPVSLLDVGPTILSFASVPIPKGFKGVDQNLSSKQISYGRAIPFEDGQPFFMAGLEYPVPRDLILSLSKVGALHSDKPVIEPKEHGVVLWPWKFMTEKGTAYIYNVAKDPEEKINLLADASSLNIVQKLQLAVFKAFVSIRGYSLTAPGLKEGELLFNIQG